MAERTGDMPCADRANGCVHMSKLIGMGRAHSYRIGRAKRKR